MSTFTFEAGRIAIGIMGPWMLPTLQMLDRFEWDVALFPQGPAGRQTRYASVGFTVWKGTHDPELAWDVLKHMVSSETTTKMAGLGSDLPPQRSVAQAAYPKAETPWEEEVFVRSMDYNVRLFPQELWWEECYRRMLDELDAALTGRESVEVALADAHKVTNAYLDKVYAEEGAP
jgi:multiple sugar transport system substrate-binding protein